MLEQQVSAERPGYELAFEDDFDGDALDERCWLPYYLPASPRSRPECSPASSAAASGRIGSIRAPSSARRSRAPGFAVWTVGEIVGH
jgi:hypothetical protein